MPWSPTPGKRTEPGTLRLARVDFRQCKGVVLPVVALSGLNPFSQTAYGGCFGVSAIRARLASSMTHVSAGPRFDPGWSDFPSPVLTLAVLHEPFRRMGNLSAGAHTPLHSTVCSQFRSRRPKVGSVPNSPPGAAKRPGPLCTSRVLPLTSRRRTPRRRALPRLHRSYQPMRQTKTLPSTWLSLIRRAFAGCRQSLLGVGPSRRYLCKLYTGTRPPAPSLFPSAYARFFLENIGLATAGMKLGSRNDPCNATSAGGKISGLQAFRYVRVPVFASPPGCTHRWSSEPLRAARTFTPRNGRVVTHANRGIATRLNRAIGATGLSPASLQPCRPLPPACLPTYA